MSLVTLLWIIAAAGLALTTAQSLQTWNFFRCRTRRPFLTGLHEQAITPRSSDFPREGSTKPRVSILKPLHGLDDGLRENLISFTSLECVEYEVILSIADPDDPAVRVAREVCASYPEAPFRLVIGGAARTANPKVERLIEAEKLARGEILLISDSNVRVEPLDIAETVALFDDPKVGCVSNPFTGAESEDLGATIEALHLLTFVLPGNCGAALFGIPCVVGKSMALRRDVLHAIGGFAGFGSVLAEDQAIGLAVRAAGYQARLSSVVVRNVIQRRTTPRAFARQVRWNKIRFAFSPALYSLEFLINPLPFTLLAAIAATLGSPDPAAGAWWLAAATAIVRILQTFALDAVSHANLRATQLLLTPIQDIVQFVGQFAPYRSREVVWQGHRARIGRGTEMHPAAA